MKNLVDKNNEPFKIYEIKEDFPELEGRIIDYIDEGVRLKAVVVGLNRSVGITIVDADDKDNYLLCYSGPAIAHTAKHDEQDDKAFDMVVEGIRKGEVNITYILEECNIQMADNAGVDSCAFSQ